MEAGMRAILLTLSFVLALLPTAAPAQQDEIAATIESQMDAFAARDAARAFTYASPTIQGLFGSPANFAAMVESGYPMVWSPQETEMLELRRIAGSLWQRVHVTDGAGRGWLLDYQMVETAEGWRINAVQLLPGADVGV
jgi:hypothetical protein